MASWSVPGGGQGGRLFQESLWTLRFYVHSWMCVIFTMKEFYQKARGD